MSIWPICCFKWKLPSTVGFLKLAKLIDIYLAQSQSGTSQQILNSHLKSEIPKTFETMIADVIDTVRNTAAVVNQKDVSKIDSEINNCNKICHVSYEL